MDDAVRLVHEAVDAGITFFENCWEYYNGKTENWLGRALRGRRDKVFLMTKVCTHGRSGQLALQMLEESLRRLQTDHLDLWQIHAIVYDNDPELAYAAGGVLEAFDQAKKQGKARFVGFTSHKDPAFHLKMLGPARQRRSPGAGAASPSPSKGRSHDQSWFLITTGVGLGSAVTECVPADPSGARTPTVSSPSVK